jgi:N-methylhydantoinase A/oxoprolinase/acetone carboxylase beta subunit
VKLDGLPAPILARLLRLDEQAELLADRVHRASENISTSRARLANGAAGMPQREHDDLLVATRKAVDDFPQLQSRSDDAARVVRTCKGWLSALPEGTVLEQMEINLDGHDLASVRARIRDLKDELEKLRKVLEPAPDIAARVKGYVAGLARPRVSGIAANQRLEVSWPEDAATLMAFLAPDVMIAAVMREVERVSNTPLPVAQRKQRMAALSAEISELQYVEQALIWESEQYIAREQTTPAWAILGAAIVVGDAAENKVEKVERVERKRVSA